MPAHLATPLDAALFLAKYSLARARFFATDGLTHFFRLGSTVFHQSISAREWSPVRLSRTGPNLSHLFFADDLVIFSQADLVHSGLLKDFLNNFCELSGHKVNARKTNVFFFCGG
ncbi:hypothetical protein PVK06_015481 [Gossypium arboreum]|uniref:Reverse transcriptase domain-containing protein n=1 Tax=Gossypium arboreum TaxID=29729 RepID=A0ABR0PYB8_GOSAR|nr:hypothetical protein PVK06_015481 [Gossypium arboreum]